MPDEREIPPEWIEAAGVGATGGFPDRRSISKSWNGSLYD